MEEKRTGTIWGKRNMTPERACQILKEKDKRIECIHSKMMLLYTEMKNQEKRSDSLIMATALPARPTEGMPRGSGHSDNLDVLYRYYRQKEENGTEIRMQMWRLSEEEEEIRRLWNCFLVIPEPFYGILCNLYVKKELYAVAQAAFGYSHRMFENKRKEGLELLTLLFNSKYTSLELIEMMPIEKHGRKVAVNAKHKNCRGQIELPLDKLSG